MNGIRTARGVALVATVALAVAAIAVSTLLTAGPGVGGSGRAGSAALTDRTSTLFHPADRETTAGTPRTTPPPTLVQRSAPRHPSAAQTVEHH